MAERRILWTVLGLGVALALWGGAPEAPIDLQWRAPAGCPTANDVLAMVERFNASPLPAPDRRPHVLAQITTRHDEWTLDLRLRFPEGTLQRTVRGENCAVVAEAAALIVAVLLDPHAVLAELEAANEAPPTAAPPPTEAPPPLPPTRPWRGALGLSGLATYGVLPRWSGGATLLGAAERAAFRTEIRTTFEFPRSTTLAPTSAGARFSLWSAAALACYAPAPGRFTVPLCIGPEVGWLRARGIGLAQPRTTHRALLNAQASVALTYAIIPRLRLRAHTDAALVITPHRFSVTDLGPLHETRRVAVRVGVGFEVVL